MREYMRTTLLEIWVFWSKMALSEC